MPVYHLSPCPYQQEKRSYMYELPQDVKKSRTIPGEILTYTFYLSWEPSLSGAGGGRARGSGIRDRGSGIGDRGSGIRDQGSGIRDQGSKILLAICYCQERFLPDLINLKILSVMLLPPDPRHPIIIALVSLPLRTAFLPKNARLPTAP